MNAGARLMISALLCAFSGSAAAVVTLTYSWSDVHCSHTSVYTGTIATEPCTTPSMTALVQPGEQVSVQGLFNYVYHDDGLALDRVELFQIDGTGFRLRPIANEAGGLFFQLSWCEDSRYCNLDPVLTHGFMGIRSLVLGDNRVADDLSGQIQFSLMEGLAPNAPGPRVLTAYAAALVFTFSPVSAIPEPSTNALLLIGLCALGLVARRRTDT
jgi:hypothetical protein